SRKVFESISEAFETYPKTGLREFSVIHGMRDGSGMHAKFLVCRSTWSYMGGWERHWIEVPRESQPICVLGSGSESVARWYDRWNRTKASRTSRAVFSAFCDALASGEDPLSGGAPQIVRLYRQWSGSTLGVLWKGSGYVFGAQVKNESAYASL